MHALEEAQAMARTGNVDAELDELLLHAKELLDIIDDLSPRRAYAAVTAPTLRIKVLEIEAS